MASTSADVSNEFEQKQDPDDSGEFQQDPDEFVESIQTEVTRWLDEVRRIKKPGERDGPKMGPLEKALNEVHAAVRHLKQNIDIPEVVLEFDESIQQIVDVARKESRKPNAGDLGELVKDSEFLNSLQNRVNGWIKAIQKVTKLDRDPSSGTALQEITFWINMERAVLQIQAICESDEFVVTMEALKHGKRFHATVAFESNTGLKEMLLIAQNHNQLMKDVQINELLSALDLAAVRTSISNILKSVQKMRHTKYPLRRAYAFYTTISTDLCERIIQLLKPRLLMHAALSELDEIMEQCKKIWQAWEDESDRVMTMFRDLAKKRPADSKPLHRVTCRHKLLEVRLDALYKFRFQHEQLSNMISRVLRFTGSKSLESFGVIDSNPEMEIGKAYDAVKELSYLDLSPQGQQAWESAMQYYKDHISRVEAELASRLRDQLGGAKNADEMFTIFSRYNALLVRPHIHSAIREYQTTLIERVKSDIVSLQETILDVKMRDLAVRVADRYDIPSFSATMMWVKQVESQLNQNIKRIENVLGEGWANHLEGKELSKECELLRQKLDTTQLHKEWTDKMLAKCEVQDDKLFTIDRLQRDGKLIYRIRVNYSPDSIRISKEVRNLKNLGFRIPFKIMSYSHAISDYYPSAISLIESMRIYESTNEIVFNRQSVEQLVAGYRQSIHNLLTEGIKTNWSNCKLDTFTVKLAESVSSYEEKVSDLVEWLDKIDLELSTLDKCQFKEEVISQILASIQRIVDQMALNNYSNMNKWIGNLDKMLEVKMARRLEGAIHLWTKLLKQSRDELEDEREASIVPEIHPIPLEIRIISQCITVVPSLDRARFNLFNQLAKWHGILTNHSRICCNRFQVLQNNPDTRTYKSVLLKMPHSQQILNEAHMAIEAIVTKVGDYVTQWTRYQALWDLQQDVLFDRLGSDLGNWMKVLMDIKKARTMVDSPETRHSIFPFVVDFNRVQSKVSIKYDYWQREVLNKFGNALGASMQKFFADISKDRHELESQSIDSSNTSNTVALIMHVQSLKKQIKSSQEQVDSFLSGQKLLTVHRYPFHQSWLYAENVEGEWSALLDVLNRKDVAIQSQVANLQTRILDEDKLLEKHINDLVADWNKSKPIHGTHRPKEALILLSGFEDKFKRLKEERSNIVNAKSTLEISDSLIHVTNQTTNKLEVAIEELNDLTGVWKSLLPVYDTIDELKEIPWLSVQSRKLRQNLEELLAKLKSLPSQYRSYESYDYAKRLLQNYLKMNSLLIELKSDALKERHWRNLTREMHVNWVLSELTLGQVWDTDLSRHEETIKHIMIVANGERVLEDYLRQVKEFWTDYTMDLINYQQKTKLIRGWDDLFNKLKEHMSSLGQMKLSLYYKQFEEDALSWEEKLNKMNTIFDSWIDVQRRWVYLEGLFSGSADIAHLLPSESNRFNMVSNEFLGLMRKVSAFPRILDVIHIQGVQKILERLADMLSKIQKALGEYLERERNSFPRFYFVGDEDLLEILGNSKDLMRVQKHLKKMFAGIMAVEYNEQNRTICAIVSREGESVKLTQPVDLNQLPKIDDWLRGLEREMQSTLANLLADSFTTFCKLDINKVQHDELMEWMDSYPAQIIGICVDVWWSNAVETCLSKHAGAKKVSQTVEQWLSLLCESVLRDQTAIRRKKVSNLITEFVHKKNVCRQLVNNHVKNSQDFWWLQNLRVYFDPNEKDLCKCCLVKMANAVFYYGFEYLGIQEKLVQTPLTDRCYLTMTQALHCRLGGSPFGPAGTGKTESVKALGHQLGRFVLVFNCDETFDFQAVGRILVGLCQVGAWGCFDEFNRLEERMLSAVSQQIQTIQETVRADAGMKVDLVGKSLKVNPSMAIFITMNPGYSGRSNLPDNLKQLFRSLAMTSPDRGLIAEVMLFSQGFHLCKEQLSNQCHYDFGLRALKYVLVSAGNIKRDAIQKAYEEANLSGEEVDEQSLASQISEQQMLIQSVCETLTPKLVSEDITLLQSLMHDVFPDISYNPKQVESLKNEVVKFCTDEHYSCSTVAGEKGNLWLEKVLQVYQITNLNHGLMLVGASGSGKTTAWKTLLKALESFEQIEGVAHVIDAKSISKDALYGTLDQNTREWTDGLFTHIIRKIIDNVRGELQKRQWIIFDGDVDPEWVENLNSVLDDNKLLTLPNGERLSIPPNVRIIFEVADLKYATMATVSRCGMVWFSEDVVTPEMLFESYLLKLKNKQLIAGNANRLLQIQNACENTLCMHMDVNGLVPICLEFAVEELEHIMEPSRQRLLLTFFSMLNYSVKQLLQYDLDHPDFPPSEEQVSNFIGRSLLVNLIWAFAGDGSWKNRMKLSEFVRGSTTIQLPPDQSLPITDYFVTTNGDWESWLSKVPQIEIEPQRITDTLTVIPTLDTVRHEMLLNTWLSERKPLVLCGPPGSGKTMTLLAALRSMPDMDVINVNFSSSTSPELLMKNFDHYCEYRRTPNGVVLAPMQITRWLVIFCDEINLPQPDKYGTQRVISFMRQLVEQNGFYRTADRTWVTLERIQFVGACNPPTDPGRNPLSTRFLRHVPVIYVDYPGRTSLNQIYATFARAMLRQTANLRGMAEPLTEAMAEFYLQSQEHFTQDDQPHYVYSPRELTRWVRGISEAIMPLDSVSHEDLVRLWAHEALRLFHDRLVRDDERNWTEDLVDKVAQQYFATACNLEEALKRPLLYSCWLKKHYSPVSSKELEEYVVQRMRQFAEEELDVKLVLFDQILDHVLRIDRVFRQPQGHLLLIGVSGSGKTTLSRFVAWLNGFTTVQLKVHSKYKAADFDEDIRHVLRKAGCKNEKICFIMDESNMMETGFLERLNTLLANGEVPGLFEGDEYNTLLNQIKEGAQRQGLMLDSHEELYKWFTSQIVQNLHVVFTMNPSGDGLRERASTSPALFNRCVLDWFGDWSNSALFQVGHELTGMLEIDKPDYTPPAALEHCCDRLPAEIAYRDAVVNSFVHVHNTVRKTNVTEARKGHRVMAITPRHFLDFIKHYVILIKEKRKELTDEQIHLNNGLRKINETEQQVKELQKSLNEKEIDLRKKQEAANAKLQQMLADQREAEKEKGSSEKLQEQIREEKQSIDLKKEEVERELAITQLTEVRSMVSPPNAVKVAMETICLLLGEKQTEWKAIRTILVKDDFISRILQFNTEAITPDITDKLRLYEGNPDWEFEKVNRASLACGPMVKWAKAQLSYAKMLNKVEPLNSELLRLVKDAEEKTVKGEELKHKIETLENRIQTLKDEYAQLIGEAEHIKQSLAVVQEKVNRSIHLLKSLRVECDRWEAGRERFDQQNETLVGDVLLSAAFLSYSGYYDQLLRETIFQKWMGILQSSQVVFRQELARIEYLSAADDRLQWNNYGMPKDELCMENAIMLKRFNRFPLIIDPSGQSIEFICKEFSTATGRDQKGATMTTTSALRFGTTLLVQDVESYDPILNPVLNKEVKRTGGRVLITIGDQDIDVSPAFKIFLFTRDSSVEFPADVCSRVTFVNFTITRASLETQCLHQVLRSERPDIDEKRNDLLKLQGEFAVKLRQLEKALLNALNESEGKILDNNSVIATLEKLKNEAQEVARKSAETDQIMREVEVVSQKYHKLANACSLIYLMLHRLDEVHLLYNYSLEFLLDIFTTVLKSPQLSNVKDYEARLSIILQNLFSVMYSRVSAGMLHTDKVLLAALLLRIYARCCGEENSYEQELEQLSTHQPEQVLSSAHVLITKAFGSEFMQQDKVINLREIILNEVQCKVPVLLCSATGYDVSNRIEDLALELKMDIVSIALGSAEGFEQADKALHSTSRSGRWILLKNVHLATEWLTQLEKKLHHLNPHHQFRLILTAEICSALPISMIQASRVLIFEPSTGLKANLLRSLSSIVPARITKAPAERSRLYFIICWFHAIVQERLRYQPLGWANPYEFTDADLRVACDTLDSTVDLIAQNRANVKPDSLPWMALRTLLSQCIYGGKIDNDFDQVLLDTLLDRLFTAKSFDTEFVLVDDIDGKALHTPEETGSKDSLINWVINIKSLQKPNWIGLPNNAEKVLIAERGQEFLRKMLKMSDDELAYEADDLESSKNSPTWIGSAFWTNAEHGSIRCPEQLQRLRRTKDNVRDPLFRFFEREINLGAKLLADVRRDLNELLAICRGEQKQNNHCRELVAALVKSKRVPANWHQFAVPKGVTALEWMRDFVQRVEQLKRLSTAENLRLEEVWLGGMFFPEAYITATRQLIAQTNGWSLEQMYMHVTTANGGQSKSLFTLTDLRAIGVSCEANTIRLTDEVHVEVPKLQFTWTLEKHSPKSVVVPVYLYSNRAKFLFGLHFVPIEFEPSLLSQRGVAFVTNCSL
uniref:Dynein heavy chain, cytoplasmic n=2 Tax=Globodera pallida TaxID=36090 RepID=A0A183BLW5_GLOPA